MIKMSKEKSAEVNKHLLLACMALDIPPEKTIEAMRELWSILDKKYEELKK
jgi:hypothetical protein